MNRPSKPLDLNLTANMEALNEATERLKRFHEEREKREVRRDPAGRYVAFAYNRTTVNQWCRVHEIDPKRVKIITSVQDTRGIGYDLIAVFFPDWAAREDPGLLLAARALQGRIIAFRYSDKDRPVVEKGRIVGWTRIT